MIELYIQKKLQSAKYKILEDGTYFGEIPGVRGVWSNAKNLQHCRTQLLSVLKGWSIV